MSVKPFVIIPLVSIMGVSPLLLVSTAHAVTHDEWRDGSHNTQMVRNGPTGARFRFQLDPGVNTFTGTSDCSSMPWPDYVECGEMFDFWFSTDLHISSARLWLWDPFAEAWPQPYQSNGSSAAFFTIGVQSTFSGTDFGDHADFTQDQSWGGEVEGRRLFERSLPLGPQYSEVWIDQPDGSIVVERWATTQYRLSYGSVSMTDYRLEITLSAVPELDGASGTLALGLLATLCAWRRERRVAGGPAGLIR